MATEAELFAAVQTIKKHCKEQDEINPYSCVRDGYKCPLWSLCYITLGVPPTSWPDPAKGGNADGI